MRNVLKRIIQVVIGLGLIGLIGFVAAYLAFNPKSEVAKTVDTLASIPQITLGGMKFHSQTFGNPRNPVLIVLHGGPGADYRYLMGLQTLASTRFVVFYDQRGGGLSTRKDAGHLTTQTMIDDLDLFVEHYSPNQPVDIVGHSWGAMLASAYIGQHPSKVNKLVLAEPGALTNEAMTAFTKEMKSVINANFMLQMVPIWFESLHISDPSERADYFAGGTSHLWEYDNANPYHCKGNKRQNPTWRSGAVASNAVLGSSKAANGETDVSIMSRNSKRFSRPVLFLASECNQWLGEKLQRQHAKLFPSAQVVVIKNAGHMLFNDNPKDSLAAVRAYLAR
jgi:proline iminopeptidase